MRFRPIEEVDYERLGAIGTAIDPDNRRSADWYRQRDANWNPKLWRIRLGAERDSQLVGWGQVGQMWWAYHPRKFNLILNIDPAFQQQGIGSRLYDEMMRALEAAHSPLNIGAETRENRARSVAFLEHRGFALAHKRWESHLAVDRAHLDHARDAYRRMSDLGISLTTIADERQRRGRDTFLHDLFELEQRTYRDEPGYDPEGTMQFEQYVDHELRPEVSVDDGSYLAVLGTSLVGLSRMERDTRDPHKLLVGFTGVDPAYRDQGIAWALKLRTIEYARAQGFETIRTQNDSSNAPMLHINLALGFELGPATLVFEKQFEA